MKFDQLQNNIKGFIAIIIVLIIAIIATTAAVSVSMFGLGELVGNYTLHQSHDGFDSASSCVEEALIRLRRNSSYIGGTIVLDSPCTIQIDTVGNNRTITVQSTSTDAVSNIQAQITLSNGKITINSWQDMF